MKLLRSLSAKRAASGRSSWLLWFLAVATLVIAAGHFSHWRSVPTDFRAFYSAGKVVIAHADPYRVEPLSSTEKAYANKGQRIDVVTPAPLPPYVLAIFAVVARMPIHLALLAFRCATTGAMFVIAFCLWRLSPRIPFPLAISVAYFGVIYAGAGLGQIAPFAIAGVALAAFLMREGKLALAAIALTTSLLQPQFGAPAVICALMFVPRMRIALAACCLALGGLALTLGLPENLEYISVLRLQARAEVAFREQYSLTWLLHYLGCDVNTSLFVSSTVALLTFAAVALFIARHRIEAVTTGAVVLLPVSVAVLGGTFIHEYQLSVALLPAILLLPAQRSWFNPAIIAALFIIPFSMAFHLETRHLGVSALPCLIAAVATAWSLLFVLSSDELSRKSRLISATCSVVALCAIFFALLLFHPTAIWEPVVRHQLFNGDTLSPIEWRDMIERSTILTSKDPFLFFQKLPMWLAVLLTVALSCKRLINPEKYGSPLALASASARCSSEPALI